MQTEYTLIKKKIKFSSYLRKFRWDRLQSQNEEGLLNTLYEEMHKYLSIYEEVSVYRMMLSRNVIHVEWRKEVVKCLMT
jgi:hypothetical protein